MANLVVFGAQWGDEGKGKITDYLAERADMVVRFQGGDNAGHTVIIKEDKYKLHLIPSGIFYSEKPAVIANGVVVNPKSLLKEIKYLNDLNVTTDNLKLSDRAHLVFPYHIELDRLQEERRGAGKIGTTVKGIGPCYKDKVERCGIRVCDMLYPEVFEEKLRANIKAKNEIIEKLYEAQPLNEDEIVKEYLGYAEELKKYITDTVYLINGAISEGKKIVFEGAQGALLDIDFGTYPYLTSSHPISGGVPTGAGVPPASVDNVLGVVKAYTTRVGKGPFPTELHDKIGEEIREKGFEYGTTTGRARRCGWLDMVMLKYSATLTGLTGIALTKLDTLAGFETLKICVGYEIDGKRVDMFPASLETLAKCVPVYEEHPGWTDADMEGVEKYEDLPENAKKYVERIEELAGVKIRLVSVGPERNETFILHDII